MAEQNPNARPDEQTPEQDALEKSLEELSLDELLASVKDDLARVDAMMDGPGDAAQPEQPDAPAPDTPDAAEEASKPGMQPLFEPKIPEEYADLTVVDFSDTAQSCKTYDEFIDKAAATEEKSFTYLGIG